ncbi:hypothetical protein SBA1_1800005 [Candidatus Sulfotelmatobacter kueseliae]|uniref:Uncharacterized protein n=1 Tax=Candidatus Sulfotelmatobacter kueseliae TaxID=2042962 RepID=A0A2U3KDQ2_9BACT|nr:hypothetical protein SBA1_1800005 [Candidatus Sulfotelmatobacter kueseliae]
MYIKMESVYIRWYPSERKAGHFHANGKESVTQALSVGFRENQARSKSFASEDRD